MLDANNKHFRQKEENKRRVPKIEGLYVGNIRKSLLMIVMKRKFCKIWQ